MRNPSTPACICFVSVVKGGNTDLLKSGRQALGSLGEKVCSHSLDSELCVGSPRKGAFGVSVEACSMVVQHWLAAHSGSPCLGFCCLLPGSPGLETSLGYRMSVFFSFFWNSRDVLRDEHSKRNRK